MNSRDAVFFYKKLLKLCKEKNDPNKFHTIKEKKIRIQGITHLRNRLNTDQLHTDF